MDCGKGEIAVIGANGSDLRVLTHDKVTETSPAWSPNHEQIAFIRPKAHTSDQIWVMNADGSNQHAVTHFRNAPQLFGNDVTPDLTWSPDGQELVFAAFRDNQGGREQLYVVNVRTHAVRRLTNLSTGATEPEVVAERPLDRVRRRRHPIGSTCSRRTLTRHTRSATPRASTSRGLLTASSSPSTPAASSSS